MTRIFVVKPKSKANGDFLSAWFDDEAFLWGDERLDKAEPLLADWSPPRLELLRPKRRPTPVLYNPNALAISAEVRTALGAREELELLPIEIQGCEPFFILHPLATVEAPGDRWLRRGDGGGGNIIEIFGFPPGFAPGASFFRVRQPLDSAAGRAGFVHRSLFVNDDGARVVASAFAPYLIAVEMLAG